MAKLKPEQPEAPEGKIIDFIDGKLRADNETEQVRQNFERTLIEEYRYDAPISVWTSALEFRTDRLAQKKASIVVFSPGAEEKRIRYSDSHPGR